MSEHHDGSFQQRGSEDMAQPSSNSIIFHPSPLLEMEHSSPSKKWKVLKEDQLPLFHCNECLVLTDSSRVTVWDGKPGCYANCFSLEKLEDIFIQKKASLVNVTFSFLATDKRLGLRQLKRKQVRSAVFDFTKRHCSKNEFQANAWQVWEQSPPIIST